MTDKFNKPSFANFRTGKARGQRYGLDFSLTSKRLAAHFGGCARLGATKLEILTIGFVVLIGLAFVGPWLLQSRSIARANLCQYRVEKLARTTVATSESIRRIPGYLNDEFSSNLENQTAFNWVLQVLPSVEDEKQVVASGQSSSNDSSKNEPKYAYADYLTEYQSAGSAKFAERYSGKRIGILQCPDDLSDMDVPARLSYAANVGRLDTEYNSEGVVGAQEVGDGLFLNLSTNGSKLWKLAKAQPWTLQSVERNDGVSHTIMFTESDSAKNWFDLKEEAIGLSWTEAGRLSNKPMREIPAEWKRPSARHQARFLAAKADASSEWFNETIPYDIWVKLMRVNDVPPTVSKAD